MKILIAGVTDDTIARLTSISDQHGDSLITPSEYQDSLELLDSNPDILIIGDNLSLEEQQTLLSKIHHDLLHPTTLYLCESQEAYDENTLESITVDDFLEYPYTDTMLNHKLQHLKKFHEFQQFQQYVEKRKIDDAYEILLAKLKQEELDWHFEFDLVGAQLREFEPKTILEHVFMEDSTLEAHKAPLYTILSELYTNALDHGILGLSSKIKKDPHGFMQYYEIKEKKLQKLNEGKIRIHLAHCKSQDGGWLSIVVNDTGKGFDYKSYLHQSFQQDGYSGRGIPLLEELCESVCFNENGNLVQAIFAWKEKSLATQQVNPQ